MLKYSILNEKKKNYWDKSDQSWEMVQKQYESEPTWADLKKPQETREHDPDDENVPLNEEIFIHRKNWIIHLANVLQ